MKKKEAFFLQINFKGFIPGSSYLHKVDARIKILTSLIVMGASISLNNLISLLILFVFVLVLILFSNIKYSYIFSPIPPLIPFLFIAIIFRLFSHPEAKGTLIDVIWQWKIFIISKSSLYGSFILLLRFLVIFTFLTLFSATTKLEDFTRGIERIFRPFQRVGIPAHEFSMVISIAVGFFHVLANEMNRIIKAQVSRGADFEANKFNLIKKMKKFLPLLIPLFSFSLEHSKYLVEAMEARCYRGGKGRSYYTITGYSGKDYVFIAVSIVATLLSFCITRIESIGRLFIIF